MAFPPKASIESIDSDAPSKEGKASAGGPKGPPPASPKPRSASDSSLYSSVGKAGMSEGQSGLGAEGSSPAIIGMQGLALVQRGLQMLNLAFPENPGLVATLADITGRLQTMIPQLVAQASNPGMGGQQGMGMMGMAMQQPQPGMGGGMPMPPGGMPPSQGAPMQGGPPPMPPMR